MSIVHKSGSVINVGVGKYWSFWRLQDIVSRCTRWEDPVHFVRFRCSRCKAHLHDEKGRVW